MVFTQAQTSPKTADSIWGSSSVDRARRSQRRGRRFDPGLLHQSSLAESGRWVVRLNGVGSLMGGCGLAASTGQAFCGALRLGRIGIGFGPSFFSVFAGGKRAMGESAEWGLGFDGGLRADCFDWAGRLRRFGLG